MTAADPSLSLDALTDALYQELRKIAHRERLRAGGPIARTAEGLAVMHLVADHETGEVSAIAVLARHGEIPKEFEEQIRAL